MFNDVYIAVFNFGEYFYIAETFFCAYVETDYDDIFNFEINLN